MRRTPQATRARGILMADALIGLAIAVVLLVGVGLIIVQQSRAERKLAEIRRDMRSLETALLQLQATGQQPQGIQTEKLTDPAPANHTWIRLSTKTDTGQLRSLVGLVPTARTGTRGINTP